MPGNKCTFYRDKNVQEIEDILTKEFSILCEFGNNFVDNKWSIYFEENKSKCIIFSKTKHSLKL